MAAQQSGDAEDIRCGKCGYKWEYTGELWRTTCPRCGKKTETPLMPDEE